MNDRGSTGRLPIILGGVALVELVKHAVLWSLGQAQPWGDSAGYWCLAGDAAAGDVWLVGSGVAYRTPGYPWFLAGCRWLAGENGLLAAIVLQHVGVLLTSLATTWLTWRITQRPAATMAAAVWCALCTARPLYANWLLTESLATLALTVFVVALHTALERRSQRWLIVAGCVLGGGILIRPALLAALPALLLAGWWVANDLNQRGVRRVWVTASGSLMVIALLTPWCVRNFVVFNRFALTIFTGRELWKSAFDPWPGGELPIPTDGAGAQLRELLAEDSLNLRHNWTVAGALSGHGLNDRALDELMEEVAWQAIRRAPGRFAFRTLARCATFWYVWEWEPNTTEDAAANPFAGQRRVGPAPWTLLCTSLLRWTPERLRVPMVLWSAATWCGIWGLLRSPAQHRTGWLLALIFAATTVLTATLEVPLYRYRLVLEPLMIVATVSGAASWRGRSIFPVG